MKLLFKILLGIGIFLGLQQCIERVTRGFCLQKILCSDLPFLPQFESALPSSSIEPLLEQEYTFLGAGSECFAFLSQDGTTVIKFFKLDFARPVYFRRGLIAENYASFAGTLSAHPLTQSENLWIKRLLGIREFRIQRTFSSLKLAFDALQEETGMLYLHLNPTNHLQKKLTLKDACGVAHVVDLDSTRFFLQKKAVPIEKGLATYLHQGQKAEARACIDSLVQMILSRCRKGFSDRDILDRNFGFIGTQAIEIDSGSFIPNEKMQDPAQYKQELFFATLELKEWLQEIAPEMALYLEEKITEEISRNA
ncbi:MAG: hypothetical protein V4492_03305 [Chlamydiota bacterium]